MHVADMTGGSLTWRTHVGDISRFIPLLSGTKHETRYAGHVSPGGPLIYQHSRLLDAAPVPVFPLTFFTLPPSFSFLFILFFFFTFFSLLSLHNPNTIFSKNASARPHSSFRHRTCRDTRTWDPSGSRELLRWAWPVIWLLSSHGRNFQAQVCDSFNS